nr:hypothetical protein [Tanacetum cinerariifolium]
IRGASGLEVRLTVEIVGIVPIEGLCFLYPSRDENSSIDVPILNSFNDPPNVFTHPLQPHVKTYSCKLCGNDSHYGYDCPPRFPLDTSGSDSECDLSSCDAFSPIDIPEGKFMIFSNRLFNLNNDFTTSDDESLSDEDVLEDNVKIYSNPLFKFDDEYISSDVNPLFDELLENVKNKDSYDSNLDEPDLLVIPLFDANEDECFNPRGNIDEIDAFDIPLEIPYGEIKAHIEVLSILWGKRLPIQKVRGRCQDKIICDLNKTPDLFQEPPQNCPKCGNTIDGQHCQGCALLLKELKEVWVTVYKENGIFQGLLHTSKSSNDNTNVVNAPQEPFVVKQDRGKNSSQSPPHINHHCCYRCGDSLEDIFCHQCTCESCGKGAHYGYNCLPNVSIIPNSKPCNNQTVDELP